MPPVIKKEEEIYNDLKTGMQTEIPSITNYSAGSVIRALLSVIAAALRLVYINIQTLYFNQFPMYSDIEACERYYDMWGLTWDDPDLKTARSTILNKYRENAVIGTKKWYEDTVKDQFPIVTRATLYPNYRGPGTADLLVLRNNGPIFDSDITAIQNFFDADANKVLGMDLLVTTMEDLSA